MAVKIPVSVSDFLNRIAILIIKIKRTEDCKILDTSLEEVCRLTRILGYEGLNEKSKIGCFYQCLRDTNECLLDMKQEIKKCEARKDFGSSFVALARAIVSLEEQLVTIKEEVDRQFN